MAGAAQFNEIVKTYTPLQMKAAKKRVLDYYKEKDGEVGVKVLSRVGRVPQKYVVEWLKDVNVKEDKGDLVTLTSKVKEVINDGWPGLNDQQVTFAYHYMKTYNVTTSAARAGYPSNMAHQTGQKLMKKPEMVEFLRHIRNERNYELSIEPKDLIREYMKIAFADMTDFVKFSNDTVILKHSGDVDGGLITKIKSNDSGVTIELADKLKALERLEKLVGVDWKRDIEERKLKLIESKILGSNEEKDDGFIEALAACTDEVWDDV